MGAGTGEAQNRVALRPQFSERTRSAERAIYRKNHLHAAASLDRSRGMDCAWMGKQFVADSCRWLRLEHADLARFAYLG